MDLEHLKAVLHGAPFPTSHESASTLAYAQSLDAHDPLSKFRSEFHIPAVTAVNPSHPNPIETSIYLCGNSLGLQPKRTRQMINDELDIWAERGVVGHFDHPKGRPWVNLDQATTRHAAVIVGARENEVAVMGSLTGNVHLLMASFYKPTKERYKIIIESKAFPSDHYAVVSQLAWHDLTESDALICIGSENDDHVQFLTTEQILKTIDVHAESTALLFLSGVQYYTGQAFDIPRITAHAQSKGIVVGWDLAHAAGNIPLQLHDWNVDFAAWCSYKYLNSGPGAIAGLFVHSRHDTQPPRSRLAGWWGHDRPTRFQMRPSFNPIPGAAGYQLSNPSVLDTMACLSSLELFSEAGPSNLWTKSKRLTGYLDYLLAAMKQNEGEKVFEILTPADRGAQLSIKFKGEGVMGKVFLELEKRGVIVDQRRPDVIRVAPTPMYNSFEDVWRFVEAFGAAIEMVVGK